MQTETTSQAGERTQLNAPQAVAMCVMKAALEKLNECRMKCDGIGGDVDASNLRWMIKNSVQRSGLEQASKTLRWISKSVKIDAKLEIMALEATLDTLF